MHAAAAGPARAVVSESPWCVAISRCRRPFRSLPFHHAPPLSGSGCFWSRQVSPLGVKQLVATPVAASGADLSIGCHQGGPGVRSPPADPTGMSFSPRSSSTQRGWVVSYRAVRYTCMRDPASRDWFRVCCPRLAMEDNGQMGDCSGQGVPCHRTRPSWSSTHEEASRAALPTILVDLGYATARLPTREGASEGGRLRPSPSCDRSHECRHGRRAGASAC